MHCSGKGIHFSYIKLSGEDNLDLNEKVVTELLQHDKFVVYIYNLELVTCML